MATGMKSRLDDLSVRYGKVTAYLCVLLIIALPLFGHLDESPIRVWDEMRGAQNALEMNQTGRLIVTTIDYKPETWNTKPPLMVWILAISQRIFGYNEIAVRLPSAIAATLTCLLLLHFAKRRLGRWLPGTIAVLILVTTKGYVMMHGTRTGDNDALLTLFTTAAIISLVNYVEDGANRNWLYAAAAALTGAILTKGVAGLFICPAMLGYVLLRRKSALLFQEKTFYGCAAALIIVVGGYYLLREMQQPGFLKLVAQNELGGRFNNVIEEQSGDYRFYYNELIDNSFYPWSWLLFPATLGAIFSKDIRYRKIAFLCGLSVVTILFIISSGSTKHYHYMVPIYPFLALFCAIIIFQAMELLKKWEVPATIWSINFLPFLLLLFVGLAPYKAILDETISGKYARLGTGINDAGVYLKESLSGARSLGGNVLCGDSYPLFWYKAVLELQNKTLKIAQKEDLINGMEVITWEDEVQNYIQANYIFKEKEVFRRLKIYSIVERK